jgi:hypothetical protein
MARTRRKNVKTQQQWLRERKYRRTRNMCTLLRNINSPCVAIFVRHALMQLEAKE